MDKNGSYDEAIKQLEKRIKSQKGQLDEEIWVIRGLHSLINKQKKCIVKLWIGR